MAEDASDGDGGGAAAATGGEEGVDQASGLPLSQTIKLKDEAADAENPEQQAPATGRTAGELGAALSRRRNLLKNHAQTFESSPEQSTADASHLQKLKWNASKVKDWLRTAGAGDAEEDRTAELFSEGLSKRGPLPTHSPLATEMTAELQQMMSELAELRGQVAEERVKVGGDRDRLASWEAELRNKEEKLSAERAQKRPQKCPRPEWLTHLEGTLNIGLVGNSGVGKSLLINRLRDMHPGAHGWAPVGVRETTMSVCMYAFPNDRRVRLWDFPGAGTEQFPRETYIQDMGLRYLDQVIIVTAGRYTETEIAIMEELSKFRVPNVMVRTKIDIDVWNNVEDNQMNQAATVHEIREDLKHNNKVSAAFLVSLRDVTAYDFPALYRQIFPCMASGAAMGAGWDDPWAIPQAFSQVILAIQGRWHDPFCQYYVRGNQVHVARGETSAVVSLEEDMEGNLWWCSSWWISAASAAQAKTTSQLRWAPVDLQFKPLIWTWSD